MSLKTNESTQKKKKSLRDLFGDDLTETGKVDLERAGELAAQDLARVIFSEKFVSAETEINSGSVHTPSSESIESGVYWNSHIPSHYRAREVEYNLAKWWNEIPATLITGIKPSNSFDGKAPNSEQWKALIESMARNMNESASGQIFHLAGGHGLSEGYQAVTVSIKSTLKLIGLDGEGEEEECEYVTFIPGKRKEERMRLRPQTARVRRRQLAHKVK
ncbi:hypothetical protein [Mangrovibacter phragmitis]|uniref:hypothetical protein n=1 Tax=Mangrovibacter phragmitis TaxID=1691903 RepID=UPI003369C9CE